MGRMSRQRRYKSCDPFTIKKKENKYDNPPKKSEMKFDNFFKTKNFEKNQNIIDRAAGKDTKHQINDVLDDKREKKIAKTNHSMKNIAKSSIAVKKDIPEMKPNETKKQYFQRLDESIQEAISKTMMETKTLRKKRKLHLKSRDEKIKQKKKKESGEVKDFSDFKDDVKFGEVAERPPSFSAIPRGATKDKKLSSLQLSSLFDKTTDAKSVKKRKEMTYVEQQRFDNERQKAIDAYRMIKKQKMKDLT